MRRSAAFLRQELADAELVAPVDAVVRTRLMEPGEMASPQKPVFSLAVTDPKWVRAYVAESDFGKLHPGTTASIVVDSFPDSRFEGWVGFISPVAEFTPKTVETDRAANEPGLRGQGFREGSVRPAPSRLARYGVSANGWESAGSGMAAIARVQQ